MGELYKLTDDKMYACAENEVLIPHALAVAPSEQG